MSRFMDAFDAVADAHWQMWWSVIQQIDPKAYAEWDASRRQLKGEMPESDMWSEYTIP
jgi:hypothetical protein